MGQTIVSYVRVSADEQGVSGVGAPAQRAAVAAYASSMDAEVIQEFKEVENGEGVTYPELAAAIAMCKRDKVKLVIAKLDRLWLNAAFANALRDSGIDFAAVDNPAVTPQTIQALSKIAEKNAPGTSGAVLIAKKRARRISKDVQYKDIMFTNCLDKKLTLAQIKQMEKRMGCIFPESYRAFLLAVNGGVPKYEGVDDLDEEDETHYVESFYSAGFKDDQDLELEDINNYLRKIKCTYPSIVAIAMIGGNSLFGISTKTGVIVAFHPDEIDDYQKATDKAVEDFCDENFFCKNFEALLAYIKNTVSKERRKRTGDPSAR